MNVAAIQPAETRKNQLLAALPDAEWRRWQAHLELVDMRAGQVLCEAGDTPRHAWFPTTAAVSLMNLTQEGECAEIALVGSEGVVGISLFMHCKAVAGRAVVQSAGKGYRLCARSVIEGCEQQGRMQGLVLAYAHGLIMQVAQIAVCNRYHSLEKQFCRRLLAGLDHLPTNQLAMTHQSVASLLGVRREGVTAAALKLQRDGLIRYTRGHITVLDRHRLEKRTCECYAAAKNLLDRSQPMSLAA